MHFVLLLRVQELRASVLGFVLPEPSAEAPCCPWGWRGAELPKATAAPAICKLMTPERYVCKYMYTYICRERERDVYIYVDEDK